MKSIRLLLEQIKLSLQKRTGLTQNRKSYENWKAKGYNPTPEVSIIIQSHNKSLQIKHILQKLRKRPSTEIIVIDDGSTPSHTRRLTALLTQANEFLFRCNDLYENITYDRTIRMANGKYIALLQDDDDFEDNDWIDEAINHFKQYPSLAILGGKLPIELVFNSNQEKGNGRKVMARTPFDFVEAVNRAPMWINQTLYTTYLSHIDYRFAPFQYDDYELCARTWLNGLQVGWYDARFKSLSSGGMRLWNRYFTTQQCERNGKLLYTLYHHRMDEIKYAVHQARTLLSH